MNPLAFIPGTDAWRRRRDLSLCRRTSDRIQEIVDGEMREGRARRALERHLSACARCGGEADAIRDLKNAIALVGSDTDPALVRRLKHLAKELFEDAGSR